MKNILNFTKQIDIFGVPIPILTNRGEEKYRSMQGGLITLLIVVLSLVYLVYIIQQWIAGNLSPSISTRQKTINYLDFTWNEELITFSASDPTSTIDPFSRIKNYITPLLFTVHSSSISDAPIVLFSDPLNPGKIDLKNGSLVLNNVYNNSEEYKSSKGYLLVFAVCNKKYMTQDSICASDEELQQYFSEFHGFLQVSVNLQQYHFTTNKLEIIPKSVFFALSLQSPSYAQLSIKQQQTVVDDGILMVNNNFYLSPYDYSIISQQVDSKLIQNTLKSFYKKDKNYDDIISIATYQIQLDNIELSEIVTYPKLNTILAQIGAIVQVIFFLKYIAIYINGTLIEEDQLHQIVMMYYPNLKHINIKRNILGSPISANSSNEFQKLSEGFLSQYKKLIDLAKQKTSLTNIIYEISRLQFIVESRLGLEILQECHNLGAKIQFWDDQYLDSQHKINIESDSSRDKKDLFEPIKLLSKDKV